MSAVRVRSYRRRRPGAGERTGFDFRVWTLGVVERLRLRGEIAAADERGDADAGLLLRRKLVDRMATGLPESELRAGVAAFAGTVNDVEVLDRLCAELEGGS